MRLSTQNGVSNVRVEALFSEAIGVGTVNGDTFTLVMEGAKTPIEAAVRYDATGKKAILTPRRPLERGGTYTATITTGAKDLAGNALARNKVWSFKVRG